LNVFDYYKIDFFRAADPSQIIETEKNGPSPSIQYISKRLIIGHMHEITINVSSKETKFYGVVKSIKKMRNPFINNFVGLPFLDGSIKAIEIGEGGVHYQWDEVTVILKKTVLFSWCLLLLIIMGRGLMRTVFPKPAAK